MTNKENQSICNNATNNITVNPNREEGGFTMKEFVIQVNEEFDLDVLEADLDDCLEQSDVGVSKEDSTFDSIPVEEETSVKLDIKIETEEKQTHEQPHHNVRSISKTKIIKPRVITLKSQKNVKQTPVKRLKCELCSFRTTVSSKLRRHVGSVHMKVGNTKKIDPPKSPKYDKNQQHDKWFKCALCSYKTNLRPNLRKHIGSVHMKIGNIKKEDSQSQQSMQNKSFSCGHCEFRTVLARDLHIHVRNQHQHKPLNSIKKTFTVSFKCEYCPYRTNSKAHLGIHLRTHSTPLKKKSEKTSHSNEQSPKKDFKCEFCPFSTNLQHHLTKHVEIIHTNPGKCRRVQFKDKIYLSCNYCNIKIRDQRSMRHHMICKHVSDDLIHWFICNYCKMKFKLTKYLNYHIARVHIQK